MPDTKFRSSWTSKEGIRPAVVLRGRVVNVNVVRWTIDFVSTFDRKNYFNIQVGAQYMHHSQGEGIFAFPEVGAACMVCVPGDSSPPFVLCFVMAHESVDGAALGFPQGTSSHAQPSAAATDASFAGGRPKAIPGSIYLRGRDGNFIALHRGGVVQIGATELSQRIFIPLRNLIVDMSENYEHHNMAGSIKWGIQEGPSEEKYPGQFLQTFRIFANDKYADVKVACGKVFNPTPEPDGGVGLASAGVGQGTDNPIILEVAVSPKGFIAESGDIVSPQTVVDSVMKFTFDRKGNTLLRLEGNVVHQFNKKLTIQVKEDIEIATQAFGRIKAANGLDIDGGAYAHVKGGVVRLGPGATPVARLADVTSSPIASHPVVLLAGPISLIFPTPIIPGTPILATFNAPVVGTLTAPPLAGSIVTAQSEVLA